MTRKKRAVATRVKQVFYSKVYHVFWLLRYMLHSCSLLIALLFNVTVSGDWDGPKRLNMKCLKGQKLLLKKIETIMLSKCLEQSQ
jgi:hypothetical protein